MNSINRKKKESRRKKARWEVLAAALFLLGLLVLLPVRAEAAISLNKTSVFLWTGRKTQLKAEGSKKTGSWSSSDSSVVSVDQKGLCVARRPGTATIVYKLGKSKVSCKFTIENKISMAGYAKSVRLQSTEIKSLRNQALGSNSRYRFMQGSATDGKYAYFMLGDSSYQPYCALVKVDMTTWKTVKVKTGLHLYHGNDMTYNKRLNKLVVVHGSGDYNGVSYVSPQTLTVTKSFHVDSGIYGAAYDSSKNRYATASGEYIEVRNSKWQKTSAFQLTPQGSYTHQGIDCDNRIIYVFQSDLYHARNRILMYTWGGYLLRTIQLNGYREAESLFHVGKRWVLSFNDSSFSGGVVYETSLQRYYSVRFYPGDGVEGRRVIKMAPQSSKVRLTKLPYSRPGYSFAGWIVYRVSDGKMLYRKTTNGKLGWAAEGFSNSKWKLCRLKDRAQISPLSDVAGDCIVMTATWKKK